MEDRPDPFPVLLLTPSVVVVDKPAGLVVIPARDGDPGDCLHARLQARRGERLWVVHRIDRDTSGIVAFARTADAHRRLSLAFQDGQARKAYRALVQGTPPAADGTVDVPLHEARRGRMRPALPGEAGALPSATGWRLLRRWDTPRGPVSLVEALPRTGRQHQVRVHLRFLGCPLLADPVYGRGTPCTAADLGLPPGHPGVPRLALHAARLELPDPDGGPDLSVDCPLAPDLQAVVDGLEGRAGPGGDRS